MINHENSIPLESTSSQVELSDTAIKSASARFSQVFGQNLNKLKYFSLEKPNQELLKEVKQLLNKPENLELLLSYLEQEAADLQFPAQRVALLYALKDYIPQAAERVYPLYIKNLKVNQRDKEFANFVGDALLEHQADIAVVRPGLNYFCKLLVNKLEEVNSLVEYLSKHSEISDLWIIGRELRKRVSNNEMSGYTHLLAVLAKSPNTKAAEVLKGIVGLKDQQATVDSDSTQVLRPSRVGMFVARQFAAAVGLVCYCISALIIRGSISGGEFLKGLILVEIVSYLSFPKKFFEKEASTRMRQNQSEPMTSAKRVLLEDIVSVLGKRPETKTLQQQFQEYKLVHEGGSAD